MIKVENKQMYARWQGMWQRCMNPVAVGYENYGGRGIKVCERWLSFEKFLADVGQVPFPGAQLDRQDNDGDYSPDNVKWSTVQEQANNRRVRRDNLWGVTGVSKRGGNWRATATVKGQHISLYTGPDFEVAVSVRKAWEEQRRKK